MTPNSAIGNRRRIDDAEMRRVITQIRRLLDELENPRGTLLDAEEVAEQLEAIRHRRVHVVPAPQPKIVEEPWDDWSDPDIVPLNALGLRQSIYGRITTAGINTVGLVAKHSPQGLIASGVQLGPQLLTLLIERLMVHGLDLPADNSGVPVRYVIDYTPLRLFGWWTRAAHYDFAEALGLQTMGDVSRLTVERIRSVPFGDYITSGPNPIIRPMSPDSPQDVSFVVTTINNVLGRYGLAAIPTN